MTSGVVRLFSTQRTFVALKDDGSVVTWGSGRGLGLNPAFVARGVADVFSNTDAFASISSFTPSFVEAACESGSDSTLGSDSIVTPCTPIARCAAGFVMCTDVTDQHCRRCDAGFALSADAQSCTPAG